MAETKNLLVYTTYEEMIKDTPTHGQYCQVGEKFYQYLEEDEFDRALFGNDRWVPVYPETVQIILPEDDYTTPSQVEGLINDSKNDIEELYKSADVGVLEAAKSYVDGRFVDNNKKMSDIETSIQTLRETDNSIKTEFKNECTGLWDAIAALQDKLSEEEKVDLVKELKPELDKIYRLIENSYDIDGTKNEIARQIKETTDVMWAQINDKYTSEEECVSIYKELLKDLNTDIDSKISDKASIDYVQGVKADVDVLKTSKVNVSDIHKVATSGSYNDLSNKPIIPESVTEETVEGWGFTKNQGDYNKPEKGIPFEDLSTPVQNSLKKADDALTEINTLAEKVDSLVPEIEGRLVETEGKVDILLGDNTVEGSIDNRINTAVSGILDDVSVDFDTLKEVETYITSDKEAMADLNTLTKEHTTSIEKHEKEIYSIDEKINKANTTLTGEITRVEQKIDSMHQIITERQYAEIQDFSSYAEGTLIFTYKEE